MPGSDGDLLPCSGEQAALRNSSPFEEAGRGGRPGARAPELLLLSPPRGRGWSSPRHCPVDLAGGTQAPEAQGRGNAERVGGGGGGEEDRY